MTIATFNVNYHYLDKEKWKVLRGYWFEVAADNWYPFSEADYAMIEQEHCNKKWREKVSHVTIRSYHIIILA